MISNFTIGYCGDLFSARILVYELLNHDQVKNIPAKKIAFWIESTSNCCLSEELIRWYKSARTEAYISLGRVSLIAKGISKNIFQPNPSLMILINQILDLHDIANERNDWNELDKRKRASYVKALNRIEQKVAASMIEDKEEIRERVLSLSNHLDDHEILILIKTILEDKNK